MAVGDDYQNIYAFKGASVAYIRRFEEDYLTRQKDREPKYLIENYRSTANIIRTSNLSDIWLPDNSAHDPSAPQFTSASTV